MTRSLFVRRHAAAFALAAGALAAGPSVAGQADVPPSYIHTFVVNNGASANRPAGSFDVGVTYSGIVPGTSCRTPIVTRLSDDPDGAMQAVLRESVLRDGVTLRVTDDPARSVVAGSCSLMAVGRPTQP